MGIAQYFTSLAACHLPRPHPTAAGTPPASTLQAPSLPSNTSTFLWYFRKLSLCPTLTHVTPRAPKASISSCSFSVSKADVASSSSSNRGSVKRARANASRYCSPTDKIRLKSATTSSPDCTPFASAAPDLYRSLLSLTVCKAPSSSESEGTGRAVAVSCNLSHVASEASGSLHVGYKSYSLSDPCCM